MLSEASDKEIQFCDLVEHPGGHDGGEFPVYETFKLEDGGVTYTYGLPHCSCDTFSDCDPEDYNACPGPSEALARLQAEREALQSALGTLDVFIQVLADGQSRYSTACTDEPICLEDGDDDGFGHCSYDGGDDDDDDE